MDKRQRVTSAGASTAAGSNKPLVFSKMEALVREMQHPDTGVPVRSPRTLFTSIPSAFMGYDLVEWLMDRLEIDDSAEAINLANLLCQYGYFFPIGETRSLVVKDDSSRYRFQTPYYWPTQCNNADTTDYAIYLSKRLARNRQKHGLEDYEAESYNKLKKGLQHKWDFIQMQADEQVRLAKDRKKGDKIVTDSQERAYWRVYRPPPGYTSCLETAPVPDRNNMANRVKKKTVDICKLEIDMLDRQIERTRMKASAAGESLITYAETFQEYDPFLFAIQPSNPWITDDITYWLFYEPLVDAVTDKRMRRWAINFSELVNDATGLNEFTNYLRKEYCHENIRFWQAVVDLRYGPVAEVSTKVKSIYDEFLKPGAPCEINIDGKTMEETQQMMKNPSRYTYDLAAEHVYVLLLKKDCYPRFLRSEFYKNLMANAIQPSQKKRFFHFVGTGKKKPFGMSSSNNVNLQAQTPQPLKRHGSDEQAGQATARPGFESLATPGTSLAVHQARIDCEPPYSAEKLAESNICPWDVDTGDNVCPWESSTAKKSPSPHVPTAKSEQTGLSIKNQPHLSKLLPDRSKSVEVGIQKPTISPKTSSNKTFRRTPSPEKSPISPRSEKAIEAPSVHLASSGSQSPTRKPPSSPSSSPKELFLSSLAPSETSPQTTERRASEGILKMGLGVYPLEDIIQVTQKTQHPEDGDVKLPVPKAVDVKTQQEREKDVDFSVRSGHLRDILGLSAEAKPSDDIPVSPISKPKSDIEISIASSMAAVACRSFEKDLNIKSNEPDVKPTGTKPKPHLPVQIRRSCSPTQGMRRHGGDKKTHSRHFSEGEEVTPQVRESKEEIDSLDKDDQEKSTSDVCPWEDDSLTPTWL